DCPPVTGTGLRPNITYNFQFIGSWGSEADCVRTAFSRWQAADGTSGLNAVFAEGSPPKITLTKVDLQPPNAGGITSPSRDGDGYVIGFGMQFTNHTDLLQSCDGFLKVTLHELGHGHGLGDTQGTQGSSVMNQMSGPDDGGGNIP